MKVAVVGATGLVGSKMLQVLAERNFPVTELIPVASERSIGKEVEFKGIKYKITRVVVSTYQSVTGTGKKAVDQLRAEREKWLRDQSKKEPKDILAEYEMAYKYPIDLNVIPQIDVLLDNAYTKEEMKMVNETKKIMRDDSIRVTATTVRIPVMGGHGESVNV